MFLQLKTPVAWAEEEVRCVLGIASRGDAHVELLGQLAELLQVPENLEIFYGSDSKEEILKLIASGASL